MKHKYFKQKTELDKIIDFYKIIDSIVVENIDCRDIFDDAIKFQFGKSLDEYNERDISAIIVNNIRHNCSNYDELIKDIYKVNRCDNDYAQYKNCVLEKISNVYPSLKDECNRQKRNFDMVKICTEME